MNFKLTFKQVSPFDHITIVSEFFGELLISIMFTFDLIRVWSLLCTEYTVYRAYQSGYFVSHLDKAKIKQT